MSAELDISTALAGCDEDRHPSWARHTRKAIRRLAKQGVTTIPELLEAFPSLAPALRVEAAYILGRLGRKRDVPVLVGRFEIEDSEAVQQAIVKGLGEIGGKRACRALQRWLEDPARSPALRWAACYERTSFVDIDDSLVEVLLRTATSAQEDPLLRGQAIEALANRVEEDDPRHQPLVDALLACASDPSGEVRFWSIFALGQLHAEGALPVLRRLAQTDDFIGSMGWENREEARDVIYFLTTGSLLEPDASERAAASRSTPSDNSSDS